MAIFLTRLNHAMSKTCTAAYKLIETFAQWISISQNRQRATPGSGFLHSSANKNFPKPERTGLPIGGATKAIANRLPRF
jgi:hypothetical protein